MDDLNHIAEGIKRIEQLFEMRCEDHAELMRYAFDVVNFPSNERVRALKAVVEQQKAKWRGLGERNPKTQKLSKGYIPDENGDVPNRGHFM